MSKNVPKVSELIVLLEYSIKFLVHFFYTIHKNEKNKWAQ